MTVLSVVFSFRNEEEPLAQLIHRVREAVLPITEDFELIFVDDDSTDRSLEILKAEHAFDPRIKVISMSRRFGVGPCIMAGIAHAQGDAVVYMDADLQDPPELIPTLVAAWRSGADVVHTHRVRRLGESWTKIRMTRWAYKIIGFGASNPLPVEAGDFKLLSRRATSQLLRFGETDPFVRGLVTLVGFRQVFVEYERAARLSGTTHFPAWSSNPWKTFVWGLTSMSFAPIYAILVCGFCALLADGLLIVGGITSFWIGHSLSAIYWLATIGMFFWGSTMIAIGIVAVYLIRIYKDVRGRPSFIIRETIGM